MLLNRWLFLDRLVLEEGSIEVPLGIESIPNDKPFENCSNLLESLQNFWLIEKKVFELFNEQHPSIKIY